MLMSETNNFICLSINHRLCGEQFRSLFTFEKKVREKLLFSARTKNPVIVCTCNRTELYYNGDTEYGIEILCLNSGVSKEEIKRRIMIFTGEKAIEHLFKVSCGIDSMVIGEDEILGQVKSSYAFSKDRIPLSAETHMIFQSAAAAAKKIKTCTELSKTSVSTATLAAKEAAKFFDGNEIAVMLIGASGKIGTSLLKNLLSYKNVNVYVTERSHKSISATVSDNKKMIVIPYDKRLQYIANCSCIISSTTSPHYTITSEMISEIKEKLLLIDLAVPRDIDPECANYENVSLISIDHFQKLAEENNAIKLDSVNLSERIILKEIDELKKQLEFHAFFHESNFTEDFKKADAMDFFYKLKSYLTADAFSQVIQTVKKYGEK